jgi:hypothetical protein
MASLQIGTYFKERKVRAVPWHKELVAMGTVTRSTNFVIYSWRISPDLVGSTVNSYNMLSAVANFVGLKLYLHARP